MLSTKAVRQGKTLKLHVPRDIRDHLKLVAGDHIIWTPLPNGDVLIVNGSNVLRQHIGETTGS